MIEKNRVRSRIARSGVLALALALAACSGGDAVGPKPVEPTKPSGPAPVATVSLDGDFTLEAYSTKQLTPVVKDAEGTTLTGRELTYLSKDTLVATVSSDGVVTAVTKGQTSISATSEGKSDSVVVTVDPMPATVVIRVVTTDQAWGQETIPGWPNASPVKDEPGYSLYDLEIGRDANRAPAYLSLYKFRDYATKGKELMFDEKGFAEYRAASLLATEKIAATESWETRSSETLAAFEPLIDEIMKREKPTRIVLEYSGHGGPTVFFAGALTFPDAREFLKYVRQANPGVPLILDFSTNCDVGYFDFIVNFYGVADYLLASEREYGGYNFSLDTPDELAAFQATNHDLNLPRFWEKGNDLTTAFDLMTATRKGYWQFAKKGILAVKKEESFVVYDLSQFTPFMDALGRDPDFDPIGLEPYAYDIGTYVVRSDNAELKQAFEKFRIRYVSTRDLVPTWTKDTHGFSVDWSDLLASYMAEH